MKTVDKIDRFDLEQDIMNCWQVVDDIKTLTKRYLDGPVMSQDEVSNVLIGLEALYQMKFEQLFGTFEQCIKNGKLDYDDRLARIDFLQKEIELIKSRFEDQDTGHLRTAVSVLEARVREESGWLVGNY
jgi:hypothetical protein